MKILHVIQSLDVTQGGPVSVLYGLSSAQAQAGHSVSVYTTRGRKAANRNIDLPEIEGVHVTYFPYLIKPLLLSFSLRRQLKNKIGDYDILHIHGLYRFPVTYAAWSARQAGVPYIIRPHGSLDPFLYRQSRYGKLGVLLKRIYEHLFDVPNLNHASAIHYTTKEEMELTTFLNIHSPAVIVPNGLDWRQYAALPQQGGFRKSIGIELQKPLVLFLGRINFVKGLDLLIPSFAKVLETIPEACLAIVGPDNEKYGLKVRQWCREQHIEDKVFFVGHLGPEAVRQAYVDADVFILPSYTENFGMTVVEAMACGCPVVVSDQVNIWRKVQEEGAGLVVGLDTEQIANAIRTILADKESAAKMGYQGRIAAEKYYSWTNILEQMTDVYQRSIG